MAVSVTQYGTGVGIDENELNSLRIYPNPAKDEFIVEVNPSEYPEFSVQLLNLAGVEILSKQCSGKEKYSVDISSVKSGSYMIRIKSGEKMINRIILIMK
jgi:aminopeptidase YwaD